MRRPRSLVLSIDEPVFSFTFMSTRRRGFLVAEKALACESLRQIRTQAWVLTVLEVRRGLVSQRPRPAAAI